MRGKAGIYAILAAAAAGEAAAQDWRAVASPGEGVTLVDADSVTRRADGRIRFVEHGLVGDPGRAAAFGYDSYSVQVTRNCADLEGGVRRVIYYRDGRRVAGPSGDARPDGTWAASNLCRGNIGLRSFPDPQAALLDSTNYDSEARLVSSVSPTVELTGTVVQGFEVNGVALCGSEAGCSADAPREFCWLSGNVAVPAPPGTTGGQETMRRDSADLAFRGRILRSPTGRGFGHVGAYGCLVEVEGEARPAAIPPPREREPERGEIGRTPAAAAAHAALDSAFASAGAVTAVQDGSSWRIDALKARPHDWEAACGSDMEYQGRSLQPYPTAVMWGSVESIEVAGPTLTIRTGRASEETQFHLPTPAAAERLAERLGRLGEAAVESIAQQGLSVVVRLRDGSGSPSNRSRASRRRS